MADDKQLQSRADYNSIEKLSQKVAIQHNGAMPAEEKQWT
jgi:hypothetical protein